MRKVVALHGIQVVILLYITKIPVLRELLKKILVRVNILGSKMYLSVTDGGLHRKLLLKGIREEEHTRQIQRNIAPGMTGIELGANIGYFALVEAKIIGPQGRIYCIEPGPGNIKILEKNIRANNLEKSLKTFRYLIGDHDGLEKLYLSEFGNVHSVSSVRNKMGSVETPMVTLDTFMDQNDLKPEDVDFLRMDIEGYEVMAFQGMQKLLNASSPLKIFMEFHPSYYPEWGWTLEKFLRYLKSFNFQVRELVRDKETTKDGRVKRLFLSNPSIEEILNMQEKTLHDGCQAFLERTIG